MKQEEKLIQLPPFPIDLTSEEIQLMLLYAMAEKEEQEYLKKEYSKELKQLEKKLSAEAEVDVEMIPEEKFEILQFLTRETMDWLMHGSLTLIIYIIIEYCYLHMEATTLAKKLVVSVEYVQEIIDKIKKKLAELEMLEIKL